VAQVGIKELLEAGVHFGHQTRRWNPKMRRFIFGERDGIYIIDLLQTQELLESAREFASNVAHRGGTVLFVGTKKQARDAIKDTAEAAEMPYVNHRWLGGLLTNFQTISLRIRRLHDLERYASEGQLELLPTRERMAAQADLEKLRANLGGVKNMQRVPDAVFVIDLKTEAIAVREAQRLRIPIIGLVDTNCDPDGIDYVIPGNDDAIRSCAAITRAIGDVVAQGHNIFRAEEERARLERERQEAEERARREAEERARQEAEERARAEEEARRAAEEAAAAAAAAETAAASEEARVAAGDSEPAAAPEASAPTAAGDSEAATAPEAAPQASFEATGAAEAATHASDAAGTSSPATAEPAAEPAPEASAAAPEAPAAAPEAPAAAPEAPAAAPEAPTPAAEVPATVPDEPVVASEPEPAAAEPEPVSVDSSVGEEAGGAPAAVGPEDELAAAPAPGVEAPEPEAAAAEPEAESEATGTTDGEESA
jgi:small subunit ribosomal protein S2